MLSPFWRLIKSQIGSTECDDRHVSAKVPGNIVKSVMHYTQPCSCGGPNRKQEVLDHRSVMTIHRRMFACFFLGSIAGRGIALDHCRSQQKPVPPKSLTFEEASQRFLRKLQAENRTADTVRKYRLLFKELGTHGKLVTDFTIDTLSDFGR